MNSEEALKTSTVKGIYSEYHIPKNLEQHMLRVAALAKTILAGWSGEALGGEGIVQECVFHDVAKPMNFDLEKQAQFGLSPEDITKLADLQKRIKSNFGTDEHAATVGIVRDIGCKDSSVRIVDNLEWSYIPKLIEENDIESLIAIYCDMRIGLKGILSLDERLEDLRSRSSDEDFEAHSRNGKAVERIISRHTEVNLAGITDEEINKLFDELLNSEVGKI